MYSPTGAPSDALEHEVEIGRLDGSLTIRLWRLPDDLADLVSEEDAWRAVRPHDHRGPRLPVFVTESQGDPAIRGGTQHRVGRSVLVIARSGLTREYHSSERENHHSTGPLHTAVLTLQAIQPLRQAVHR